MAAAPGAAWRGLLQRRHLWTWRDGAHGSGSGFEHSVAGPMATAAARGFGCGAAGPKATVAAGGSNLQPPSLFNAGSGGLPPMEAASPASTASSSSPWRRLPSVHVITVHQDANQHVPYFYLPAYYM
ncbi:hypothetical protein PR202_ga03520 [Eleusine coracana subsp. coracana]|uniref:Uncharacterized protein n=1 Tax=Eleusine coracana subsp. coracana TaxID=191504 RepID=A0AAV5BMK6_ELECO|nr:hypothetical protein PR202_ga03520 [Eleusine coracana subsp. coracana]